MHQSNMEIATHARSLSPRRSQVWRCVLLAALLQLTACGGGGGGGNDGGSGGTTGGATTGGDTAGGGTTGGSTTGGSTTGGDTTGGSTTGGTGVGGGGKVATMSTKTVPGTEGGKGSMSDFVATNDGLYMTVSDDSSEDGRNTIVKLTAHGNFMTAQPVDLVFEYAPSNRYSEIPDVMSFYWYDVKKFGQHNVNTGTPSFSYDNNMFLVHVAAGSIEGSSAVGPWAIGRGPDIAVTSGNVGKYFVYHDDHSYSASDGNNVSGMFSATVDTDPVRSGGMDDGALLLADPQDYYLFYALGATIDVYSHDGLKLSFTLSNAADSSATISQLSWHDGDLWIAFGHEVVRYETDGLASGKIGAVKTYAQVDSGMAVFGSLTGSFCISGDVLYTSDGVARVISSFDVSLRQWDWISKGTLSADQQSQAQFLRIGASGNGIFCADNSNGSIYTRVPQSDGSQPLVVVEPLDEID